MEFKNYIHMIIRNDFHRKIGSNYYLIIKDGLSLNIENLDIHLYVIATKYV